MKVMMTEIKHYQSKNTMIKLERYLKGMINNLKIYAKHGKFN